jgi:hypothetical protein
MGSAEASLSRTRTLLSARHVITAVSSLFAIGAAIASPSGCGSNPPVKCTVESATGINGDAIARYTVLNVNNETACATSGLPRTPPPTTTAASGIEENPISWYVPNLAGSVPLGVESYTPNPEDPNYSTEYYSMAIKPEWIGVRIADAQSITDDKGNQTLPYYPYATAADVPAPPPNGKPGTNFPYAWGQFESIYPDPNGICHVEDMASDLTYPDIPAHSGTDINGNPVDVPDQPATQVKYDWTNVRTFVTATAQGVQAYANLAITRDDCTITYSVSILVPRVQCPSSSDSTMGEQAICDPNPDGPDNLYGSGISEAVSPVCENVSNDPKNPDFECLPPESANDPQSLLP